MKDSAVSAVIAYMILLVITVSFIALLNAIWIPQMKQQAEVEHLSEIEESFSQLSADIERLIVFGQDGTIKEEISLGGGDVVFSAVRSSGYVKVTDLGQWMSIKKSTESSNFHISSIEYHPIDNFWINQSYYWKNGIISIKKPFRSAYLQYFSEEEVNNSEKNFLQNCYQIKNITKNGTNVSDFSIVITNITPKTGKESFGGNGLGTIVLDMDFHRGKKYFPDVDTLSIKFDPSNLYSDIINSSLFEKTMEKLYCSNILITPSIHTFHIHKKSSDSHPFNVTIETQTMNIGIE